MLKKPKNEERMTNNNSDDDCTADELPDIDAGNCFKKLKRTELACEAPMIENLEELPDVYCMQSPSQYDQKESQTSKASDDQVNNTSPVLKPEKVSKTDPHAFPLRKKRLCKPWDEYSVTLPSKSDGKTLIFTRKPTFSLAGSSRDTAEETSARYYQNYLRCKRRSADYVDRYERIDDTERSSRSDKPTSAAPPAPAKSKASSSTGNDSEISCPICSDILMDIKERRGHLVSTVCGHLFCEVCLDAAVRRTQQCPTCRRRLTKRQFHKLFI
ncbi:uncharacterized protein LOC108681412 [Hyalella azteca]|uniref:Uncharacterized protein LOC108681412 n=1 Tax=Hyalella azteca TaxID=294128 RepID=A0A979FFM8_HYAAZ|nr:uncharacterized protein LOC108681412 [Hyalella azteca]